MNSNNVFLITAILLVVAVMSVSAFAEDKDCITTPSLSIDEKWSGSPECKNNSISLNVQRAHFPQLALGSSVYPADAGRSERIQNKLFLTLDSLQLTAGKINVKELIIRELWDETASLSPFDDSYDENNAVTPSAALYVSNETALKIVERNINSLKNRKKVFSIYLERSTRYLGMMKNILREKGLPEELAFLPLIESGFNSFARSKAGAVGQWQFLVSTAESYGLTIDWWIDERRDPIKSTHAAARYLKYLYDKFGSWKLALASYNAGQGRVRRAIKMANSDDFWHLKMAEKIPKETRLYVPQFIAAAMIAISPEEHGFYNLSYHEPIKYDTVTINSPVNISVIAECAETTVKDIRRLNPELKRWATPPNVSKYTLRIPPGSKEIFFENLAKIPLKYRFTIEYRFTIDSHRVRKGDTLTGIAKRTGVPLAVILKLNAMSGKEILRIGDIIKLPQTTKRVAPQKRTDRPKTNIIRPSRI